jgi:hypothetical protein
MKIAFSWGQKARIRSKGMVEATYLSVAINLNKQPYAQRSLKLLGLFEEKKK